MSEDKIIFNAELHMKTALEISKEHLSICEPCIQRTSSHSLGNENVSTNKEILLAAKFASDATQGVTEIIHNINNLIVTATDIIDQSREAEVKLTKARDEHAALKAGRALTRGQKFATAITAVVGSVITLWRVL